MTRVRAKFQVDSHEHLASIAVGCSRVGPCSFRAKLTPILPGDLFPAVAVFSWQCSSVPQIKVALRLYLPSHCQPFSVC